MTKEQKRGILYLYFNMKSTITSLFGILASLALQAQSLKDIKLDNKQSILNNKAFFNFPTAARNEARTADIMSTDFNINQETRIVYDSDKMKLVFFAQELYFFGEKDLFKQISEGKNKVPFKHKILTDKNDIQTILSTPEGFDSTKSAILVNSLMVKMPDNTLFRISAYINPEAYRSKDEYIKLTEQVFASISNGTRKTNLSAREESLNIFGTKKEFKFSVPENYCITIDQKYDFQVFKFHKYVAFSDPTWVSLTIYTGHHPSYFHRDYGFEPNSAKKVDGKFLDKKIEWLSFYSEEQKTYLTEQMIKCDKIEEGLVVHIAMLGGNNITMEELKNIVESIHLK